MPCATKQTSDASKQGLLLEANSMLRREFFSVLVGLSLAGCIAERRLIDSGGPQFYVASRGKARVYIFGFGEARDKSWLTPSVQQAFQESSQLWLENAPRGTFDSQEPTERQAAAERMEKLSLESGRTFFDVLESSVRKRTLAYLTEFGVAKESVETLRPWRAYYVINSAFWSTRKLSYEPVSVDGLLREMANSAGKSIGYEMPNDEVFVQFMAAMSDKAQSQYIEWLLDFLDDYKKGLNDDDETFGWITGRHFPTRSLDRMRTKMPELYQIMQPQRNKWWANKINDLLTTEKNYFVGVGQLHVMGSDGIPKQLERLKVMVESLS
jgi:hypothetical protein